METLALLTELSIPNALRTLPAPWTVDPDDPSASSGQMGAWLEFYGIVRSGETKTDVTRDADGTATVDNRTPAERPIDAISYEAHPKMAQRQLERILHEVGSRHKVGAFLVIHRVGVVAVGESSLLVRVCSRHRSPALLACGEFIDEMKRDVPIWKHPRFV